MIGDAERIEYWSRNTALYPIEYGLHMSSIRLLEYLLKSQDGLTVRPHQSRKEWASTRNEIVPYVTKECWDNTKSCTDGRPWSVHVACDASACFEFCGGVSIWFVHDDTFRAKCIQLGVITQQHLCFWRVVSNERNIATTPFNKSSAPVAEVTRLFIYDGNVHGLG